jgi:hypothetical protein
MRICVISIHILLQSGVGTWVTALYTVRGVGSGSRDVDTCRANVSVHRGSGDPSTDGPGTCATLTTHRVGADSLVLMLLSSRIDHKIGMVINRHNHLVLSGGA